MTSEQEHRQKGQWQQHQWRVKERESTLTGSLLTIWTSVWCETGGYTLGQMSLHIWSTYALHCGMERIAARICIAFSSIFQSNDGQFKQSVAEMMTFIPQFSCDHPDVSWGCNNYTLVYFLYEKEKEGRVKFVKEGIIMLI